MFMSSRYKIKALLNTVPNRIEKAISHVTCSMRYVDDVGLYAMPWNAQSVCNLPLEVNEAYEELRLALAVIFKELSTEDDRENFREEYDDLFRQICGLMDLIRDKVKQQTSLLSPSESIILAVQALSNRLNDARCFARAKQRTWTDFVSSVRRLVATVLRHMYVAGVIGAAVGAGVGFFGGGAAVATMTAPVAPIVPLYGAALSIGGGAGAAAGAATVGLTAMTLGAVTGVAKGLWTFRKTSHEVAKESMGKLVEVSAAYARRRGG